MTNLGYGAWMQEWEESERGWGVRPDGVFYYATKDEAERHTTELLMAYRKREKQIHGGATPDEYTRPCGEPKFVPVSQAIAEEIVNDNRAYRERKEKL